MSKQELKVAVIKMNNGDVFYLSGSSPISDLTCHIYANEKTINAYKDVSCEKYLTTLMVANISSFNLL